MQIYFIYNNLYIHIFLNKMTDTPKNDEQLQNKITDKDTDTYTDTNTHKNVEQLQNKMTDTDTDTDTDIDIDTDTDTPKNDVQLRNKIDIHIYMHKGDCVINKYGQCVYGYKYTCAACGFGLTSMYDKCEIRECIKQRRS